MSTKMERALVTGGAGFVGSHLCDRLLASGYEVWALDNFSTGSERNVAHLRGNARFRLIEHDVTRPYDLEATRIFNLACPASPPHYQKDPVNTTLTSVLGVLHGLQLAQKTGARFLQASTSEVYGDPEVHPQREDYRGEVNPIGPRACYDEGKRCAESLCMDFYRAHGVDVRIARIFNTYGPRMDPRDGRVVSNFIVQALQGNPITIYGDGSQTRSFCYVDDLVRGLCLLMDHPTEVGPVNIGTEFEFTVGQLAEMIIELTGRRAKLSYLELPADDPKKRRPDLGKARSTLGYEPKISLNEGLTRTTTWFADLLGLRSGTESLGEPMSQLAE